jgi:hypothetical protein
MASSQSLTDLRTSVGGLRIGKPGRYEGMVPLEYEIVSSTRPEDGDKDDAVGSPHARRRLGTTKVAPADATRFWQRTPAFYFSEFSKFSKSFWERAEANSRQAPCNLAPIWHQNPALEWAFSGMARR